MTHRIIPADPFKIHVPDHEIADLKHRLEQVRFPNEPDGNDHWEYGTNLSYMERLIAYWRDDFDWRKQETWMNSFPQFKASLTDEDDQDHEIHFVYEKGSGDNAIPLIMTHGWPSTFREFLDVVDRLAHPEKHGHTGPSFDVIVPSLIG